MRPRPACSPSLVAGAASPRPRRQRSLVPACRRCAAHKRKPT
jgi:hypothetical protein